jgi:putative membrane protein
MRRIVSTSAAVALALAVSGTAYAQAQKAPTDAKAFMNEMAIAGMAEIQLGKMASERAASGDVKAFGQMMVKDHTKAATELEQVASKMNVQLPKQLDQKHRELADRLSKLQGATFDREYMSAMATGHQEVVAKVRPWAGNRLTSNTPPSAIGANAPVGTSGNAPGEPAVREWAAKTLPVVQHHLEEAQSLQGKVK